MNKDPAAILQKDLDEIYLPLVVMALTNDTVDTLAACAYIKPGSSGPLLGIGTNGAYIEPLSNITKLHLDPEVRNKE